MGSSSSVARRTGPTLEASYSRSRHRALREANLGLEKLRFLFRLATELAYLDQRRYEHAART